MNTLKEQIEFFRYLKKQCPEKTDQLNELWAVLEDAQTGETYYKEMYEGTWAGLDDFEKKYRQLSNEMLKKRQEDVRKLGLTGD